MALAVTPRLSRKRGDLGPVVNSSRLLALMVARSELAWAESLAMCGSASQRRRDREWLGGL